MLRLAMDLRSRELFEALVGATPSTVRVHEVDRIEDPLDGRAVLQPWQSASPTALGHIEKYRGR